MEGIILQNIDKQLALSTPNRIPLRSLSFTVDQRDLDTQKWKPQLISIEDGKAVFRDMVVKNDIVSLESKFDPTSEVLLVIDDTSTEYSERYIIDDTTSIIRPEGITETEALTLFHPKQDTTSYIRRDGTVEIDDNYVPTDEQGIVPKKYYNLQGTVDIDTPEVSPTRGEIRDYEVYSEGETDDVLFLKLPTTPGKEGTVWNDGGEIRYVYPLGHIRYYTTSPVTFNTGVKTPTDGYIDIIGNDEVYPTSNQSNITKVEVLKHGFRTSWQKLCYWCRNMTEFVVSATDESKVTNFESAWNSCSSLTSFPSIDTSNGIEFNSTWLWCLSLTSFPMLDVSSGTSFTFAWRNCSKLTSFPLLDVSSGTTFEGTWDYCVSLTSFPALDVSSGANFSYTWKDCKLLTTFPSLDTSSGTSFDGAWKRCSSLTSFPLLDVSNATSFVDTWWGCSSLTSFPLLDVSNATIFYGTWYSCESLTSFPSLDTSSGTNFGYAWGECDSLTSFPWIDTSNGTNFERAWGWSPSLTSFPLIDTSKGTSFIYTWRDCSSLTSFPGLDVSSCQYLNMTWSGCTSLPHCPVGNEVTVHPDVVLISACDGI